MEIFGLDIVKTNPRLKNAVIYVNISFWVGIIADLLEAIEMMVFIFSEPSVSDLALIEPGFVLMVGWTVLMIWGVLKPIERKDILIITAFPVAFLFGIYNIFLGSPEAILNFIGTAIFSTGYFVSVKVSKQL
ncbi:MAG: hypothetical protein ACFFDI_24035 [Promethearchaeota archaeon]